jgi:hemoglobin
VSDPSTDGSETPYARLGGEPAVRALVERFYDAMDAGEPALAALHHREDNKISRSSRDRFASFLIGWLGGPDDYVRAHGHPRLRQRHAHVPVDAAMRDAWLRCMARALDLAEVPPDARHFLEARLTEVADFLRNRPD